MEKKQPTQANRWDANATTLIRTIERTNDQRNRGAGDWRPNHDDALSPAARKSLQESHCHRRTSFNRSVQGKPARTHSH